MTKTQYRQYLNSSAWMELRELVLHRCQGSCESCRSARAHEIHHLTYRDVGNEHCFQLVGLCPQCHQRYHDNETNP